MVWVKALGSGGVGCLVDQPWIFGRKEVPISPTLVPGLCRRLDISIGASLGVRNVYPLGTSEFLFPLPETHSQNTHDLEKN